MAKKSNRGGGDLTEQTNRLKTAVGREGVKLAAEIVESYESDVIRLAFKMIPKGPSAGNVLGKRIEALLANMPSKTADEMRENLLVAKAKG